MMSTAAARLILRSHRFSHHYRFSSSSSRRLAFSSSRPRRHALPLAFLLLGLMPLSISSSAPWQAPPRPTDQHVEPLTQTRFTHGVFLDSSLFRLCAVSVRIMMNLTWLERARAYAFGVYLGPNALKMVAEDKSDSYEPLLAKLNPKTVPTTSSWFIASPSFAGVKPGYAFQTGPYGLGYYSDKPPRGEVPEVMVRLVMLRDVEGDHIARGFDKTLTARGVSATSRAALSRLLQSLGGLSKGAVLDFVRDDQGSCLVVLNNALVGVLAEDRDLAWAVVDAFVGPQGHLDKAGKQTLVQAARDITAANPLFG